MRIFPSFNKTTTEKPRKCIDGFKFAEWMRRLMNMHDWYKLTGDTGGNMTGGAMRAIAKFDCENNGDRRNM